MTRRDTAALAVLLALGGIACDGATAPDDGFLDGIIREAPAQPPGRAYLHVTDLRAPGREGHPYDEVRVNVRGDATDIYVREPGAPLRRGELSDLVAGRAIRFWHGGVEYRTLPVTFQPHRVEVTMEPATP